jgi:glycerol-3-phosphate acyltransferase PlsX
VASALFTLRTIAGVDRPGIATVFPTSRNPLILLDAGANVDCRPHQLAEFALMGAAYAHVVQGIIPGVRHSIPKGQLPKVGLLSIGEESTKGNDLTRAAFKLLQNNAPAGGYEFYGNVEGRDIGQGTVDVVVCDGFVGNVVLKVAEGFAKMFAGALRSALTSDWRAKSGAALLRPSLRNFKKRLDYTEYGGAVLLGVNGVCIICHGSSDARSIYSAIRIAKQTVTADIVGAIRVAVEKAAHNSSSGEQSEAGSSEEQPRLESLTGSEAGGDNGSLSQMVDPNGTSRSEGGKVPPISF